VRHLGLTPQSVHPVRRLPRAGQGEDAEQKLIEDAVELEAAGAGLLVLERYRPKLGEQVTQRLHIPTIGIGAGPGCSGQVLVLHDIARRVSGEEGALREEFHERSLRHRRCGRALRARRQRRQLSRRRTQFLGPAVDIVTSVRDLRERLQREPDNVFVPTMGNLHAGHIQLMRSRKHRAACNRRQHIRQPDPVRAERGFRALPAHLQADAEMMKTWAWTWCSRRPSARSTRSRRLRGGAF